MHGHWTKAQDKSLRRLICLASDRLGYNVLKQTTPSIDLRLIEICQLEDWFRKILEMDYYATVGLASTNDDENQNVGECYKVPVHFRSVHQYILIFQPLVLEELKEQLRSYFHEKSSLEEMYYGLMSVLSTERVDDFHIVHFMQHGNVDSNSESLSEGALVLLRPENSSVSVHMMGKVEGRQWDVNKRSSIFNVRLHLQNGCLRLYEARRNLLVDSKWLAFRILNMTSQIREIRALSSIENIPIHPGILRPISDSNFDSEIKRSDLRSLPHSLQQILKSSFNASQLQAISVAIGSSNLTKDFDILLIQGPPGTGKTRTIVAVISALLACSSTTSRQETKKMIAEKIGRGRVLICAQSNAAVDELVSRISSLGIYGRDGKMFKPHLVRVGNAKTVHPNAMPFFLDTLVDQRLSYQRKANNEEIRALKHKLRKSILKEAQIVAATLSGCGGELFSVCAKSEEDLFDAVVIDEAAQALEPATLIPLQLLKSRGTKCIMVGDPKQLPATVLSNVASKYSYERSMFERLQRAGHPILMLTQQYRMHPEISRFPSQHFYENMLLDGVDMLSKAAPFHESPYLGPYVFYDVLEGQEHCDGSSSKCNEQEAKAAVQLLRFFKKRYPSEFVAGRIGVITPYKGQLAVLRSHFSGAFGSQVAEDMELNTVDGFQGREVDILLLSTVRATDSAPDGIDQTGIGFVADVRRMNVALTRAKLSLWILGNTQTLQRDPNWGALVKDAKEREVIIPAIRPYNFPEPPDKKRKSDGDVVHLSSKRSESKRSRRKAKEKCSDPDDTSPEFQ